MNSINLLRKSILFLSLLCFCIPLHATPSFQVSPDTLSFGELQLGQSKTLSFTITNLQNTALPLTISQVVSFYAINPRYSVTLGPNESKQVDVTFPAPPPAGRCEDLHL